MNYGHKSNTCLIYNYGFAIEENIYDSFQFRVPLNIQNAEQEFTTQNIEKLLDGNY